MGATPDDSLGPPHGPAASPPDQLFQQRDALCPPLSRFLLEGVAFLGRPWWSGAVRRLAAAHRGDGRTVMVIPGFLASDLLTRRLRRTLIAAGYHAVGWRLGQNRGIDPELLARMVARVERLHCESGRPIVLLGWSLGGLYARELAKRCPAAVDRVITLGSPFSGDLRANRAWRLYERINGYPVDRPPVSIRLAEKPPVPTFALWSPQDGIVAPAGARGLPHESDHRVAVACRHLDLVSAPAAIEAILTAIET